MLGTFILSTAAAMVCVCVRDFCSGDRITNITISVTQMLINLLNVNNFSMFSQATFSLSLSLTSVTWQAGCYCCSRDSSNREMK